MGLFGRALGALLVLLLLLCLLLAALVAARGRPAAAWGGAGPPRNLFKRGPPPARGPPSPHLVVDTLNLTHWLREQGALAGGRLAPRDMTTADVLSTIDFAAPVARRRYPGTVTFVVKDRESQLNAPEVREAYKAAADRNAVHIAVTERYAEPPAGPPPSAEHSARGRDDFYMAILARRYRCPVLTADKFRDFRRFRATIQPFHVYEYAFWRERPERDYIRPQAADYARVPRPATVHPAELFGAA